MARTLWKKANRGRNQQRGEQLPNRIVCIMPAAGRLVEEGLPLESVKRVWWSRDCIFCHHQNNSNWIGSHYLGPGLISSVKLALLTAEIMWTCSEESYLEGQMLTCGHLNEYFFFFFLIVVLLMFKLFIVKILAPKLKKLLWMYKDICLAPVQYMWFDLSLYLLFYLSLKLDWFILHKKVFFSSFPFLNPNCVET